MIQTDNKDKGGRPSKFETVDIQQVYKLASYGLIDKEIANVLGISLSTLKNYKKNKEFLASLKRGKDEADSKVIESLYKRATGYVLTDTVTEVIPNGDNDEGSKIKIVKKTKKEVAGDVVAQIFWLKNRRPKEWKNVQTVADNEDVPAKIVIMPYTLKPKNANKKD